jgi:hypothetical protein
MNLSGATTGGESWSGPTRRTLYADSAHVFVAYDLDTSDALVLNVRTGRFGYLSPSIGYVWELMERGLSLDDAAETVIREWRASEDVRSEARLLIGLRMVSTRRAKPAAWLTALVPQLAVASTRIVVRDADVSRSRWYRAAAAISFCVATALLLRWPSIKRERRTIVPFWVLPALMTLACRVRRQRPATVDSTKRAVATVRAIARRYPWRADCYNITVAAFIVEAIRGQAPAWCLGGILGRELRHAWLECGGIAIDHARQNLAGGRLQALIAVHQDDSGTSGS